MQSLLSEGYISSMLRGRSRDVSCQIEGRKRAAVSPAGLQSGLHVVAALHVVHGPFVEVAAVVVVNGDQSQTGHMLQKTCRHRVHFVSDWSLIGGPLSEVWRFVDEEKNKHYGKVNPQVFYFVSLTQSGRLAVFCCYYSSLL